jgi:TonB family protein
MKRWEQLTGHLVDGAFPLRECLGSREHSAVFLTELEDPNPRTAVIRLLLAAGPDAGLRFSRWELAAKLSHPNLIRILRTGRDQLDDAILYAVFEYAEENLEKVLSGRALTPGETREMLEPTLDALLYLHRQGLVHGQLKPANIFAIGDQLKLSVDAVGPSGEAVVTKLSVYDPAEVAMGGASPAGDIWSLGMTLVEVLTQRLPLVDGIDQREPLVPETLPEPFLGIARHSLQRDPGARWTAAEIAARLRQPVRAGEEAAPVKAPRSFWNWRYLAPAGILVLLAMFAVMSISRRPEPSTGSRVQIEPRPAPATAESSAEQSTESEKRFTPGEVVEQILPTVPPQINNTIQGRVRVSVRVRVDPAGSVTDATLDSRGPSKYFADLALQAARRWKFTPAKIGARAVASEWVLRFEFLRTGPRVTAVPVTS